MMDILDKLRSGDDMTKRVPELLRFAADDAAKGGKLSRDGTSALIAGVLLALGPGWGVHFGSEQD